VSDHCYMCRMTSRTVAELRVEGHLIDEAIKTPVFHLPLTTEVDDARQQGADDERAAIVEIIRETWRRADTDAMSAEMCDLIERIEARGTARPNSEEK
jgi:hypothetical protein